MKKLSIMVTVLMVSHLVGCQSVVAQQGQPALLTAPLQQNRVQIEQAVGKLLGSAPVKLADNAFTHHSSVMIERAGPSALNMRNVAPSPVDKISLVIEGKKCWLLHQASEQKLLLEGVSCQPVN